MRSDADLQAFFDQIREVTKLAHAGTAAQMNNLAKNKHTNCLTDVEESSTATRKATLFGNRVGQPEPIGASTLQMPP